MMNLIKSYQGLNLVTCKYKYSRQHEPECETASPLKPMKVTLAIMNTKFYSDHLDTITYSKAPWMLTKRFTRT